MTHDVKVSMQGLFEHRALWYWRCSCGDQGTMLTTEEAAHDEARAHQAAMSDSREAVRSFIAGYTPEELLRAGIV